MTIGAGMKGRQDMIAGKHSGVRRKRTGLLLLEMMVAAMLVGVILVGIVPIARGLGLQRRLVTQQGIALAEATALLQQARGSGRASLPKELSAEVLAVLPKASLTYDSPAVPPGKDQPAGEWLRVTIEWMPVEGVKAHRVSQAAWIPGKESA